MNNILLGNVRLCLVVIIVNLLSLLIGLMQGWPSPILVKLSTNETVTENPLGRVLTDNEQTWIASAAFLGGVIGAPLMGLIMDKFGRRVAIVGAYVPIICACFTEAFGDRIGYFYASRVSVGMGVYSGIVAITVYLGEISDKRYRGILYSTAPIFISIGLLLCFSIGPYTSIQNFNLIIFASAAVGLITTWYIPETPQFLLQSHQSEKAWKSLEILRNSNAVQSEFLLIQGHVAKNKSSEIFQSKAVRKSLKIALGLVALEQLSGNFFIYSYTQPIFRLSGSKLSANGSIIVIGGVQILATCITTIGVDWFGRKKMLTFSSFGLAFALGILGIYFQFEDENLENYSVINWMPLVYLMVYFIFYNSGLSSLPFLYITEILPLSIKCQAASILMSFRCTLSFLLVYFQNNITENIGGSGCFYLSAIAMLAFALYVLIILFETRGKGLDEIYRQLNKSRRSENAFAKD